MTAMEGDLRWLETLAHLGGALLFLLVGWRLGRESVGRPMFDYRVLPPAEAEIPEEADPWSVAVAGRPTDGGRSAVVDIFETLRPASGANNAGRGGLA